MSKTYPHNAVISAVNISGLHLAVKDSISAYIVSLIMQGTQSFSNIASILNNVIDESALVQFISMLESEQLIHVDYPLPDVAAVLKRDYSAIALDVAELESSADIPDLLKLEILFLYHYGLNSNFYRILNVPTDASPQEVATAYAALSGLFEERLYAGRELGDFSEKLATARKIIEKTAVLLDPAKRQTYDHAIIGKRTGEEQGGEKKKNASGHFANALLHSNKNNFKDALLEINLAINIDPNNSDYKNAKEKLEKMEKAYKLKQQFELIQSNDFFTLDSGKLSEAVEKALQLGGHSGATYLKAAEVLQDKGYLSYAEKLAATAIEKDSSLTPTCNELIGLIHRKMEQKHR